MKITIERSRLLAALNAVGKAIAGRSTMPILGNVLLRASDGTMHASGTDLEIGISTEQRAQVHDPGSITLPARLLTSYVAALADGDVDISVDQQTATAQIASGGQHANIKGMEPEEYPTWSHCDNFLCSLDADRLRQMVRRVAIAAATDESRPILTGVLCRLEQHMMTLAAADGYRLAIDANGISLGDGTSDIADVELIVPARSMLEVARLADERVSVYVNGESEPTRVEFRTAHRTLIQSALIGGRFPDYRQIIPPSHDIRLVVDRDSMRDAIKLAGLFARNSADIVRFGVSSTGIEVKSSAEETGDSTSFVFADEVHSDTPLEIAFNGRYILDGLAAVDTKHAVLDLIDAKSPGVLRMPDVVDWQYVIMPMHLERR